MSIDATPTTYGWDRMDIVRETTTKRHGYTLIRSQRRTDELRARGQTLQSHADAMGHVRLVTDSAGAVAYSASYDAWGNLLNESGTLAGSWFYGYMGAAGCRRDTDTELVYCRARWLDPSQQRFISKDVLRGANRYNYANNNPSVYVDFTGLEPAITNTQLNIDVKLDTLTRALNVTDPNFITIGPWGDSKSVSTGTWGDPMGYVNAHGTTADKVVFYGALTGMGGAAGGIVLCQPAVSLAALRAAAVANGANLSNVTLRYTGAAGTTVMTWLYPLMRRVSMDKNGWMSPAQVKTACETGSRYVINLTSQGLSSMENALNTVFHELQHIADGVEASSWELEERAITIASQRVESAKFLEPGALQQLWNKLTGWWQS